jgi:hypothetical protein
MGMSMVTTVQTFVGGFSVKFGEERIEHPLVFSRGSC